LANVASQHKCLLGVLKWLECQECPLQWRENCCRCGCWYSYYAHKQLLQYWLRVYHRGG